MVLKVRNRHFGLHTHCTTTMSFWQQLFANDKRAVRRQSHFITVAGEPDVLVAGTVTDCHLPNLPDLPFTGFVEIVVRDCIRWRHEDWRQGQPNCERQCRSKVSVSLKGLDCLRYAIRRSRIAQACQDASTPNVVAPFAFPRRRARSTGGCSCLSPGRSGDSRRRRK